MQLLADSSLSKSFTIPGGVMGSAIMILQGLKVIFKWPPETVDAIQWIVGGVGGIFLVIGGRRLAGKLIVAIGQQKAQNNCSATVVIPAEPEK